MQSTLPSKQSDDPHDVVVVAPDAVRVAPSDEELSNLLQQAARKRTDTQTRAASEVAAGATVPPVDTTFRPAVNDVRIPGKGWSIARRALRACIALLLAGCIGLAAVAWKSYGDTAKKKIAQWTTQIVLIASLAPGKSGPAAQPAAAAAQPASAAGQPAPAAAQADAANAAASQPLAPAPSAAAAVAPTAAAPSPDSAQLQSMARDLASLGQEVEQLKASIEQLKASQQQSQQQTSRDVTRPPEQNPRPRISSLPPRPAAARPRKPIPPYPPTQAAVAPPSSQAPAPYYAPRQSDYAPRQSDYMPPQVAAEPQADPELSSVPRPPMPVR